MKSYQFGEEEGAYKREDPCRKSFQRRDYSKCLDTNQRIQEIKKKYDTPSRRERLESMRKSKDFDSKENLGPTRSSMLSSNHLQDSFAVNRPDESIKDSRDTHELKRVVYEADYRQQRGREDEEAVFSRMRELKQSFIHNQYLKAATPMNRSSFTRPPGHPSTCLNDFVNRKEQMDPRVENIDKINSKIKQILSCLAENEKKTSKYSQQVGPTETDAQSSNRESAFFGSRLNKDTDLMESKKVVEGHSHKNSEVLQRYKIKNESSNPKLEDPVPSREKVSPFQRHDYSVNKPIEREDRLTSFDNVQFWRNRTSLTRDKEIRRQAPKDEAKKEALKQAMKVSRSRSYIDSIKKSAFENRPVSNYLLSSGKKLNDQITKIQRKIEQFEEQKKKLNIEFTPFSSKTKSTANLFNQATRQTYERDSSNQEQANRIEVEGNRQTHPTPFAYQTEDAPISALEAITPSLPKMEENNDFEIKKRTAEGIEERRRRLETSKEDVKGQATKSLVSSLCEQAKIDQQFRNLKIWYESCSEPDRLQRVTKIINQTFAITAEELSREFALSESESNPFFTMQDFAGNLELLARTFIIGRNFWESHIKQQFNRGDLEEERFDEAKMDLQKKGYIELEDIVRFMNIQSGTFFRNRDIYLIYHRFTRGSKLTFADLLNTICKP